MPELTCVMAHRHQLLCLREPSSGAVVWAPLACDLGRLILGTGVVSQGDGRLPHSGTVLRALGWPSALTSSRASSGEVGPP